MRTGALQQPLPRSEAKTAFIPGSAMWNPDFTFLERATGQRRLASSRVNRSSIRVLSFRECVRNTRPKTQSGGQAESTFYWENVQVWLKTYAANLLSLRAREMIEENSKPRKEKA